MASVYDDSLRKARKNAALDESRPASGSARALAGIAVAVFAAVMGALNYYQFLSAYSRGADGFQVALQQQRFSEARAVIPESQKVGYLSDLPPGDAASDAAFGAARYALAPRLVVSFSTHDDVRWVVGNYFRPYDAATDARQYALELVNDYRNGVALFRKAH